MALFDSTEHRVAKLSLDGMLSRTMLRLHALIDQDPLPTHISGFDPILMPMVDHIYHALHQKTPSLTPYSNQFLRTFQDAFRLEMQQTSSLRAMVGFSGGKDSVTSAIECIHGFAKRPILFHVRGINPSYTSMEYDAAQKLAKILDLEMKVSDFKPFKGSVYMEHPLKDQIILAAMIDYGVKIGIVNYTLGVESENTITKSNVKYNFSDSVEMFKSFGYWVKDLLPEYNFFWTVKNHSKSLKTICEYEDETGLELLSNTISCLTPVRFQNMRRNQTMAKYGVDLIKNRCGVCWKCCVEYLNLVCLGREQPPNDQIIRHCFDRFKTSLPTAYGNGYLEKATDIEILNVAVDPNEIDNTPLRPYLGI